MNEEFKTGIFNIRSKKAFSDLTLKIFRYQAMNNPVYRDYISYLGIRVEKIKNVYDIPFLPISFFRNHKVITGEDEPQIIFRSSGTTGMVSSRHYVTDLKLYEQSFLKTFKRFYGAPSGYCILALLPSYLERDGSSLIYMMERLIEESKHKESGFYLKNSEDLISTIARLKGKKKKIFLIGVSFALLDLAEKYSSDLSGLIVMETGGMKGMRKELVREELHDILCKSFNITVVHSEYGMTELLSQSYSSGNGQFSCPPWMKIILRDPNDPLTNFTDVRYSGGINIIDLANINSCSFIATGDLGHIYPDGTFEVLGRFDNSDIRGCNLLV
jgi:phenylacetate-coenzyme A ligase PaaK-like adenylate-forming protein